MLAFYHLCLSWCIVKPHSQLFCSFFTAVWDNTLVDIPKSSITVQNLIFRLWVIYQSNRITVFLWLLWIRRVSVCAGNILFVTFAPSQPQPEESCLGMKSFGIVTFQHGLVLELEINKYARRNYSTTLSMLYLHAFYCPHSDNSIHHCYWKNGNTTPSCI